MLAMPVQIVHRTKRVYRRAFLGNVVLDEGKAPLATASPTPA